MIMACGIYRITNNINGKKYIGQSVNIEKRWASEIASAFNSKSEAFDYPLSRAFRKYGVQNFSFEIIEECLQSELNKSEIYWIYKEDSFINGYNQTIGVDSYSSVKSESVKMVFYNLINTEMTQKEIAELCGISEEMVQGINTGRYWHSDFMEYPIRKKKVKVYTCKSCGAKISKKAELCRECYNKMLCNIDKQPEEIIELLYSCNGNFTEASKMFGVSSSALHKWCKNHNIPHRSSEYKCRDVG